MRRRRLDGASAPVAVVAALTGIALADQSFAAGALLLLLTVAVFELPWWAPAAAALAVLATAPAFAAAGATRFTNVLATLALMLAGVTLAELVAAERKRARSGAH